LFVFLLVSDHACAAISTPPVQLCTRSNGHRCQYLYTPHCTGHVSNQSVHRRAALHPHPTRLMPVSVHHRGPATGSTHHERTARTRPPLPVPIHIILHRPRIRNDQYTARAALYPQPTRLMPLSVNHRGPATGSTHQEYAARTRVPISRTARPCIRSNQYTARTALYPQPTATNASTGTLYRPGHAFAPISTPPVQLCTRSTRPPIPAPGHTILYQVCTHSPRD